jgi:hypothetical protein
MRACGALLAVVLACQQVNARPEDRPPAALAESPPGGVVLQGEPTEVALRLGADAGVRLDAALAAGRRLVLRLEDIEIAGPADGWYEIYLGLPRGAPPAPDSPHFAGNLAFFALAGTTGPAHDYDVTSLLRRLAAQWAEDGTQPQELRVKFVPGTFADGSPSLPGSASVRIARLMIAAAG